MRTSCSKRLWWIFTPFGGYSILNYYEVQTIYQIITIQVLVIVLEVLFQYSHIKSEWVGLKKKKIQRNVQIGTKAMLRNGFDF